MPTDKEIGQGLKKAREKLCRLTRYKAAVSVDMHPDVLRRRESGGSTLKVGEVVLMAEAWGVDPVALFAEILLQADDSYWGEIAQQLDCTIPMAKRRVGVVAKQKGLTAGAVWRMYLQEQIRL